MKNLILIFLFILMNLGVHSQSLYKVTLLRAAPGELLSLVEDIKVRRTTYQQKGGDLPYIIRHSQGDHWDLMIYEHIGSYTAYFNENKDLNMIFTPQYGDPFYQLVAHHETIYVRGDDFAVVQTLFDESGYFHVEMFNALPGKQEELLKQRKMENVYLNEIGREENLIFTVDQGANWDCFTLGGYRDIKHFAESADIPLEAEEKAAIKAGFKGVMDISPYLRSLIYRHHDTLGGKLD